MVLYIWSYALLLSAHAETMIMMEVIEKTTVCVEVGGVIMRSVDDQALLMEIGSELQELVNTVFSVAEEHGWRLMQRRPSCQADASVDKGRNANGHSL